MYRIKPLLIKLMLSAIGMAFVLHINAQDTSFTFNLKQSQDYAVENSYINRQATKDVEKSEKQVKETIGSGLPQVNATGNYQRYIQTPIQLVPADAFGGPEGEFSEVFFGLEQQMGAAINVDQLIFDGSYFIGLQASKVFLQITKNDLIRSELEVRNMTLVAYGDVLVAERNEEILQDNIDNLKTSFKETTALYESGFVEEQDVDQIELLLLTVTNEYDKGVRFIEIARNQLKFILGISISSKIVLTEDLETVVLASAETPLTDDSYDVKNHIDYQIVENQEQVSELLWKQQKATFLPDLSAFYSAQATAYSNEFDFLDNKKFYPSQLIGLNLSIPIFSGTSRNNRVQQAKIDFEKVNIAKQQVEQQLEINLRNTRSVYLFSLSQYQTSKRNMDLASKIYLKTKTKYDEGISSSLDLNQASNQLLETQSNFINAALSLINAKSQLNIALNKS